MPLVLLHAVVPDMDVSSQLWSVICKREKVRDFFLLSTKEINEAYDYRQVNVDYSVCNALNFNSDGLQEGLVIYDVMCQYMVNFEDRIQDLSDYLCRDPEMKVLGAIAKFHLADHVDSCFSKWTLNFMKGAGHIDGEIMETLWSGMNKVSGVGTSMVKFGKIWFLEKNVTCERNSAAILKILSIYDSQNVLVCNETI